MQKSHLTEAMSATLPARLNALRRTEFGSIVASITNTNVTNKRYIDDSKVTDHTAIIVTDVSPDLSSLSEDETRIYILIAKRMVGMFLPPARIQQTIVITSCQGETYGTKGNVLLEAGWKALYRDDRDDAEDDTPTLPALVEGQEVTMEEINIIKKQTQPPKRHTEASLLSAMENAGRQVEDEELREAMQGKGLGTPATRANIIEKLISTGYIERQKKTLVATEKGKLLIDLVAPLLKDPELTGDWEKKLMDIEQGRYHSSLFMQEIQGFTQEFITDINSQEAVTASFTTSKGIGECPLCGKLVVENKKAYGCSGWKEGCKFTVWKKVAGKTISKVQVKKIINSGKSDLIKGFKSKKGNEFDAYLKLDGSEIKFEFPARVK